ncbi:DUF3299 domain-containing protein [Alcanivorax sp. IO_7]|nr:DUF3299 domain-containing protein [Alcanivorax sp. IO_7]
MVLVKMQGEGMPVDMMWDAVEIEGTLKVDSQDTEYGTAGYVLQADSAELLRGRIVVRYERAVSSQPDRRLLAIPGAHDLDQLGDFASVPPWGCVSRSL